MRTTGLNIAVIGTGNRGSKYATLLRQEGVAISAIADADTSRARSMAAAIGCPAFPSAEAMLKAGIRPDGAIIATPERAHAHDAIMLLNAGCHLLIEKPLAATMAECTLLADTAAGSGLVVGVCHVLRYHPYFQKLHSLATDGSLGSIVSITHRIDVGIDRACHTFVRGPWGDTAATSPMLLSKCCHDTDLLVWLTGSRATSVAGAGGKRFFTPDNAPCGSSTRCISCGAERECPYSAVDLYQRRGEWTAGFESEESIAEQLRTGRYGHCVYHCGSTAVDRQAALINFESGAIATLTMNLFTATDCRDTHICLTGGTIHGNGTSITVSPLRGEAATYDFSHCADAPFHAGADRMLLLDFIEAVATGRPMTASISSALESHRICFAADIGR
jgi:predicted dehydrogenase